ncbi:MAG: hypothetical protein EHM28_04455 [Spirochaetaceae bacterium]|nr:MAG: hypothetical protein EHM28_04455 [Spirochaetaceae bacterium]
MKIAILLIAVLFLIGFITACESTGDFSGDIHKIGEDKIILIGSFELEPPLKPGEQNIAGFETGKDYINKIIFTIENRNIKEAVRLANLDHCLKFDFGKTFYLEHKYSEELYISFPSVWMSATTRNLSSVTEVRGILSLPGPFLIKPPAGCRILYFGRVRYHRDADNNITEVEIIDEFDAVKKEAEQRYKTSIDMCRVRLQVPEY